MTWLESGLLFLAGGAAGTLNAVVGSGTLVTFPALLAVGYPPVLATVSNTVGLTPGYLSGALGYRRELRGQQGRLIRLGAASAAGGICGGLLLLVLPVEVFAAVVPVLIGVSCLLVVAQPAITRHLTAQSRTPALSSVTMGLLIFAAGVYGGYFGAAQGVLLIAILTLGLDETLQQANAAKNVLSGIVNTVAALLFVLVTEVAWAAAGLLAAGSVLGGQLGAIVGRRLPGALLRGIVLVVGVAAIWQLLS